MKLAAVPAVKTIKAVSKGSLPAITTHLREPEDGK
jgi:hypothetical protein